MTGTTISIILLVIALIITNLTLLIQAKKIREIKEELVTIETAMVSKAMIDMGIDNLEDLKGFLDEEIEKEE